MSKTRLERDSMGELAVPADALYGASTERAVINFPISDLRFQSSFIQALAIIKACAAEVNKSFGDLDGRPADAIKAAALKVASGAYDDQFVVDIFQTGSGTSTNMNANEVIANLAIEILGGERGDRSLVHPNDHVNLGMSSNDCIPTAIHVAALILLKQKLRPALNELAQSLKNKAHEFMDVIKTGRTHLQDATPIRLGQEFWGYAGQINRSIDRLDYVEQSLSHVALGGTAVGTGINTRPEFAANVLLLLNQQLGLNVKESTNHFMAQSSIDEIVEASGMLKTIAVSLLKIANDIRWLGSGPRAGLGELALPEVQPGSSIMPGKVNPVIAESLTMVAAQVIGNDATITIAGQSGNFELNVMLPVAAYNLLQSIELMASASANFATKCVDGLSATETGPARVEMGLALCTALVPSLGYDLSAKVAHEAWQSNRSVRQVVKAMAVLDDRVIDQLLDPVPMTGKIPD